MIAEGIEKLRDIINKSIRIAPLGKHGPRHVLYDIGGKLEEREILPPARRHEVFTVESLARAAKRLLGDNPPLPVATVWVSINSVVCILDDGEDDHRLDSISLQLQPSPVFSAILSLEAMAQKDFVRMLDHDFAPAEIGPDSLRLIVRKLKFETHDELEGQVGHASDRMGREVRSKVTGEGELPDRVRIEFDPYPALSDELSGTVAVMCSLRVLASERQLELSALPGELLKAETDAVSIVRQRVEEEFGPGVPVFCGMP